MKLKKGVGFLVILMIALFAFTSCKQSEKSVSTTTETAAQKSLIVYSGAGLKKPMTDLAKEFEKENNIKIEYIFAGSTQLLSQLETSGKGDVFIVGSKVAYESARGKSLVGEAKEVAYHTPAIIVKKGNPKGIKTLKDMEKEGIKVILGDPKANAIGVTTQKIIEKNKLNGINKNMIAQMATVNEIVLHITEGKADAAIATKDSVFGNDKIDIIDIPENENVDQILPIAPVSSSKEKELANKFVDFVSSDKGKSVFEQYGFKPVK